MFLIFSILGASVERFQCLSEWSHCFTKRRKTEPSWTYLQKNRIKRNLKIRISQLWHTINQVVFIYEYIRQTVFLQIHFTNWGRKATLKKFLFRSVRIFPYLDVTFFQIGSNAAGFSVKQVNCVSCSGFRSKRTSAPSWFLPLILSTNKICVFVLGYGDLALLLWILLFN